MTDKVSTYILRGSGSTESYYVHYRRYETFDICLSNIFGWSCLTFFVSIARQVVFTLFPLLSITGQTCDDFFCFCPCLLTFRDERGYPPKPFVFSKTSKCYPFFLPSGSLASWPTLLLRAESCDAIVILIIQGQIENQWHFSWFIIYYTFACMYCAIITPTSGEVYHMRWTRHLGCVLLP